MTKAAIKEQSHTLTDIDISELMIVAIEAQQAGFPKVQGNPAHVAELCRLARIGLQHESGPSTDEAEARATAHYEDVLALRKQLADKTSLAKELAVTLEPFAKAYEAWSGGNAREHFASSVVPAHFSRAATAREKAKSAGLL